MNFSMEIPQNIRLVMSRLKESGHACFVVGGCVRDAIIGRVCSDYDVTTSATPEEIKGALSDIRTIDTALKHGTITAVINGENVEITTYRLDGEYEDSRHPKSVTFTRTLQQDLARRDFTVNAMAYNDEQGLVDCFGGARDIECRLIRCVGDPIQRFREDALRILRALRFASVLGFDIEEHTRDAIFALAPTLSRISSERILTEFSKLLCGQNATVILREYISVIGVFIPELLPTVSFNQHNPHHKYDIFTHTLYAIDNIEPDRILRYSALFHDIGKPECFFLDSDGIGHFYGHDEHSASICERILVRLKMDRHSIDKITYIVRHHMLQTPPTRVSVKRALSKHGFDLFLSIQKMKNADAVATGNEDGTRLKEYERLLEIANEVMRGDTCLTLSSLAVSGHDMIALGLKGKQIGAALITLLSLVLDEKLENERETLISYSKENFAIK